MHCHRKSGTPHAGHRRTHHLHGRRHRLQVVLREDALNSNDLRFVAFDDTIDCISDGTEAKVRRQILIGARNTDVDKRGTPRRIDVNDSESAASQARVDAHDAH